MTTVPFVDLKTQYRSIQLQIDKAIMEVLSNCNFILGRQVEDFEKAFAKFVGTKHAIGVSSGLDALRISLMALDINSGDEVILPVNTYIATALAVSSVGAKPVLVDCDPETYNIDVMLIESALTESTKAIIPVHLTGQSADMDPILDISKRNNLFVIEDAAQAHGAVYKGQTCGSIGIMGCFSFYPGKNLGAYGDGGMITTNNDEIAERVRRLRNYGERVKYDHVEKGLNARLDTIQAAILNVKLPHLTGWNKSRVKNAEKYFEMLQGKGDMVFQRKIENSKHVYHLFIIQTEHRDALKKHLQKADIQTGIHYPQPIHFQKAYVDLHYKTGDFPVAEQLAAKILSLPMFPELRRDQIQRVAFEIRNFFSKLY